MIDRTIDDMKIYSNFFDWAIIPDARFEQELDAIKQNFANVWCIKVVSTKANNLSAKQKQHATEALVDKIAQNKFDFIIQNNHSVEALRQKTKDVFDKIG